MKSPMQESAVIKNFMEENKKNQNHVVVFLAGGPKLEGVLQEGDGQAIVICRDHTSTLIGMKNVSSIVSYMGDDDE